jgi:hypothetical protein
MIGIHGRARRAALDQCDCSSRGRRAGVSSNTLQNKPTVAELEHIPSLLHVSIQESSNGDLADNHIPPTWCQCLRNCSWDAFSSSNERLQHSTEAFLAGDPAGKEQYLLCSGVPLTSLDQSISDPFAASAFLGKSEVRLLHHCLWSPLSGSDDF